MRPLRSLTPWPNGISVSRLFSWNSKIQTPISATFLPRRLSTQGTTIHPSMLSRGHYWINQRLSIVAVPWQLKRLTVRRGWYLKEPLPGWERRQPGNTVYFLPVVWLRSGVTSLNKGLQATVSSVRSSLAAAFTGA